MVGWQVARVPAFTGLLGLMSAEGRWFTAQKQPAQSSKVSGRTQVGQLSTSPGLSCFFQTSGPTHVQLHSLIFLDAPPLHLTQRVALAYSSGEVKIKGDVLGTIRAVMFWAALKNKDQ